MQRGTTWRSSPAEQALHALDDLGEREDDGVVAGVQLRLPVRDDHLLIVHERAEDGALRQAEVLELHRVNEKRNDFAYNQY